MTEFRDPTPEELAELERLYAMIPRTMCIGKCADSCTSFDMTPLERVRMMAEGFDPPPRRSVEDINAEGDATGRVLACPALSALGACRVYDKRPFICRAWPMDIQGMRCEHGCQPEYPISFAEALAIQQRIVRLSERADARLPLINRRGDDRIRADPRDD